MAISYLLPCFGVICYRDNTFLAHMSPQMFHLPQALYFQLSQSPARFPRLAATDSSGETDRIPLKRGEGLPINK